MWLTVVRASMIVGALTTRTEDLSAKCRAGSFMAMS